jgi:hypothetical protein
VDVVRELLTAIDALESVNARALRRAQLPESVGKTGSEQEERQLREEFAGGELVPLIATKHSRYSCHRGAAGTTGSFAGGPADNPGLVSGQWRWRKGRGVSAGSRSPQVIVEVDSGVNV